ncbi:MAG TPA: SPOR domain-containing protein [Pyrinomonadaceae bacterium]|nr:SPOR domain-containing protein [Pyrinomonadaceae bacterium]
MSYNFSFDKKTITLLLGGFAFVGTMLFIAGLLVGTSWKAEQQPAVASAATGGQPPAATTAPPAPAPQEPVRTEPAAQPEPSAAGETAGAETAASPAQRAHGVLGLEGRRESLRAERYDGDGEMKIIERAKSPATKDEETSQSSFSVQVGVFVDEKDANQLVAQLRNKGYAPFVLATNDDEARTWYAVRIGTYTDRTEATRAASNIATQENIRTFVRPLGSL